MASPQTEDGFTKIANELLEALCGFRLAGQERQVLDVIFRKTYGYGKKTDSISYGQISELTHISKKKVFTLVKGLSSKKVIGISNMGDRVPACMWINKNYDEWTPIPKKGDIPHIGDTPIPNNGGKPIPNIGDHKRKKEIKETPPQFLAFSRGFLEYQLKHFPNVIKEVTEVTVEAGAKAVHELVRLDKHDFEKEIRPAIKWAVEDDFWRPNVHSLVMLRDRKKAGGLTKFQKILASFTNGKSSRKIKPDSLEEAL